LLDTNNMGLGVLILEIARYRNSPFDQKET